MRSNRKSALVTGRTIGEKRERLETANERAAARKKDKLKKSLRVAFTIIGFIILVVILIGLYFGFRGAKTQLDELNSPSSQLDSKIEVIDEASNSTDHHLSSRMVEYINQVATDLKELGLTPVKAVVPVDSIRTVDFYIDGYTGFIKTTIDRGAGVTAEDAERLIRYLNEQGINDFEYLDVRIDGKAYWK
ncbi:hypothetical protein IKF73_03230 [Candidatus Saccharibacteria bacterium]|nr:hypothetical protein [Candidatus Saccharibacteria bacterium]